MPCGETHYSLEWENLNWERLFSSLKDAEERARNTDFAGNKEVLFRPRGSETVGDIVEKSFSSFGGEDLYQTIEEKVIAAVSAIEYGHPFTGGNKRGGLIVAMWMLTEAGFDMDKEILYTLIPYIAITSEGNKTKQEAEDLEARGVALLGRALDKQRG